MLKNRKVGFIGGGQMCEALLSGAISAGCVAAKDVTVADVNASRLAEISQKYGVATVLNGEDNAGARSAIKACEIIFWAVKPQFAGALLADAGADFTGRHLAVSIMGGITISTLEKHMPHTPVIRTMPNTPALVRRGCTGIAAGTLATQEHVALCCEFFDSVGITFPLTEYLIDSMSGVSGSGPAYACMFMQALADGGVQQGLPRAAALRMAAQMLAGTAEMVLQTGTHPEELKDRVCSPGGGTIAGVRALHAGGFSAAVMDAVEKGTLKMRELGGKA